MNKVNIIRRVYIWYRVCVDVTVIQTKLNESYKVAGHKNSKLEVHFIYTLLSSFLIKMLTCVYYIHIHILYWAKLYFLYFVLFDSNLCNFKIYKMPYPAHNNKICRHFHSGFQWTNIGCGCALVCWILNTKCDSLICIFFYCQIEKAI